MTQNRTITVRSESWQLAAPFVIARSSRTDTQVIVIEIRENGHTGRGEAAPTGHYGETVASVLEQIENIRPRLESGLDLTSLQNALPAGAARNGVDCALWDLTAKLAARPVSDLLGIPWPENITSVQTISIGTAERMAAAAAKLATFPVLKIKLDASDVIRRLNAIHQAAPDCSLLIDANESWTIDIIKQVAADADKLNIVMIEQPLPAGEDAALAGLDVGVPLGADESCHISADLEKLAGLYDVINIKLDKTGGLSEAMRLLAEARKRGFEAMVGCMLGTSLSMAPAMFVAQFARYVDLDGSTLLARDRDHGLKLESGNMSPLDPRLWGGI